MTTTVDRWIDLDSEEARKTVQGYHDLKEFIHASIKHGLVAPDKFGYLYTVKSSKVEHNPVHVKIDGKIVGFRLLAKAAN